MEWLGWAGNVLILIGMWLVGEKKRVCFLWTLVGESIWAGYALWLKMYDLSFICVIFALMAILNWRKWKETIN